MIILAKYGKKQNVLEFLSLQKLCNFKFQPSVLRPGDLVVPGKRNLFLYEMPYFLVIKYLIKFLIV